MKWLKLVMGILFLLFAYVQLNDPDPYGWVVMYTLAAMVSLFAFFDRYYLPLIFAVLIAASLWLLGLIPEVWGWIQQGMPNIATEMKAESPYIEFTREFFGLAMILGVTYWHYRSGKRVNSKAQ